MRQFQSRSHATVSNFNAPTVEAKYNAVLDGRQFAGILHNPSIPDGLVAVSGSAHYQFSRNQSLLQSIAVDGDLTSNRLVARMPSFQAQVSNIVAHYSLANSNATLRDFRAGLLGGVVTLRGTMNDISGDNQRAKFDAVLRGISLAQTKRSLGKAASGGPVAVTGTLNGTATAAWGKTFNDLVARTDATINANVASVANPNAQHAALVPAVAPSQPPGDSSTVPVEGAIHATYNAATQQLAVERSYFHTPQTNLELNGTVSHRSSLNIQLQADDLREVEAIADLFRSPSPDQPSPQPLGLAGSATFHGVVSGTTSAPHISGELAAHDLQVHGSSWKLVRAGVDASPSQVSLKDAELEPATKGRIAFDASAHLDNWTFSQSSPVEVQLNASQIDAADIQHIANLQIPVSGTLAAIVAMHGSLLNPIGSGNVTLTGAAAYGEPVTSAKVAFTGSGDQVRAIVSVIAPAGAIDANITASPNQKTYTAQLSSSGIHLDKLQQLQSGSIKPTGIVAIDAKGQGSFDNPQLDANLRIPALVVKEQTISDIRIHANLANHLATAQLTSSAVNTSITANAKVALTGDYLADATLDTQGIPIAPLLATYFPDQAANISGQTELHATLHGPLKNMQQLEAHATIPVLKLAYGSNVQLAATAPIHVDYKNATISVQRSAIKGTDTDLQFEATIPTTGTAPTAMLLLGTIDLHLAQLFDPDLRTTGQIKFNVNSYGAPDGAEIAGAINIVDASLAYPDLPVGLQHCNGSLSLTKDRINISKFQGQLGGGTLTAQGGVVLRPSIQFNLGLSARNVRMLYPQGMRENVNATLRFTGSTASALLGGTVNVTDLSFTPAFDIAGFISQVSGGVAAPPTQGFTRNVALNLAVQSSSSVNLVSRTVSVGGTANLQVRGTLDRPVILGRANLSGGDIILNGTRYVLTGGTIQFVNPSVTQPIVNLTITTSIQQYNISLRFEGPVDQLRTQYTSDPALPQADIIHLLAFGQTTEASAANGTPANQAAETLVANQVSSQLTSRISKVAGISQLSINPVLAGGSQQGPAGATITVQQRITSNLFVTFSSNVTTTQARPSRASTRSRLASPSAEHATPTAASPSTPSSRKAGEGKGKLCPVAEAVSSSGSSARSGGCVRFLELCPVQEAVPRSSRSCAMSGMALLVVLLLFFRKKPDSTRRADASGASRECSYPRGTSPLCAASIGCPAFAVVPQSNRRSTAAADPRHQSAFAPCASTTAAEYPRPPARLLPLRRRIAARSLPAACARTCSPPPGSPSRDARRSPLLLP